MAESLDLALEQVDLLRHLGIPHGEQLFDDVVDVDLDLALHKYII